MRRIICGHFSPSMFQTFCSKSSCSQAALLGAARCGVGGAKPWFFGIQKILLHKLFFCIFFIFPKMRRSDMGFMASRKSKRLSGIIVVLVGTVGGVGRRGSAAKQIREHQYSMTVDNFFFYCGCVQFLNIKTTSARQPQHSNFGPVS